MPANGTPALTRVTKEITVADPRLARPLWRGRTNVDAYTIAWLEHAEQIVRDEHPPIAHEFVVTQGSYQGDGGDPDSGTTHRLGGAVDLRWCGHAVCLLALREAGGFVWHRTPAQGPWPDHFHGGPIGHPYMDYRLAAQEVSYLASPPGNGLGGPDDGPRLNPIPRPVWPPQEDDMFSDDDRERLERVETKLDAARKRDVAFRKNTLTRLRKLEKETRDDATSRELRALAEQLEALAAEDEG